MWNVEVARPPARRGLCLVVAAPSGGGKSTIVRGILKREPEVSVSVSVTTREPRPGERDGVDYHFTTASAFADMAAEGLLLEHAIVFGRGYGTPRAPVLARLEAGHDIILDIDWQGWRQLQLSLPNDIVGVSILPPSLSALESRLRARGADSASEISRRMAAARDEISHWTEFNYVVVNDELEACVDRIQAILHAARQTTVRNLDAARLAAQMLGPPSDA